MLSAFPPTDIHDVVVDPFDPGTEFLFRGKLSSSGQSILMPGLRFGSYRLVRAIGSGGMGEVWLADQTEPVHRNVAIKFLRSTNQAGLFGRLHLERQVLARLNHPYIARLFEAKATPDGVPYFVMEWVDGESLMVFCDHHQLTIRQRLELFIKICEAVAHSHQKGFLHRDLKPSNILVEASETGPNPKIIDFGLAKSFGEGEIAGQIKTLAGEIFGTPGYMSPEQADPLCHDVDTRADVYSLGAILNELLTDRFPFAESLRSQSLLDVLKVLKTESATRPSQQLSQAVHLENLAQRRNCTSKELVRQVRGELDWIVLKALEKDRDRRYASAQSLADDVKRYLRDEPVEACPPSQWYIAKKFIRRNRGPVVALASVVFVLVLGMIGTTLGLLRALAAEEVAKFEKQRANRSASTAKGLNEFLLDDLLGQADPYMQANAGIKRNPDLTVREMLDLASRTIPSRFPDDPETEAVIRMTLGRTYMALGQFKQAEMHLKWVHAFATEKLHELDVKRLDVERLLGTLYRMTGKYLDSEKLLERLVKQRVKLHGEEHELTLDAKNDYAVLLQQMGRIEEACRLQEQILAGIPNDPFARLNVASNLAILRRNQGQLKTAIELTEKAIDESEPLLGADHLDLLNSKNNLAVLYRDACRPDLAEPLYQEVLQQRMKQLGPDHVQTISTQSNLAVIYIDRGEFARAETILEGVVEGFTKKLGPEHPDTLNPMASLAHVLLLQGKLERSEKLYRQYLTSIRKNQGADSLDYANSAVWFGQLLMKQSKWKEAEKVIEECHRIRSKRLSVKHWSTWNSLSMLGEIYFRQDRFTEAEPLLIESYLGMLHPDANVPPQAKMRVQQAFERVVWYYAATGNLTEAARWAGEGR
jgi:eukaryotic-like serine/threonine-protein kinase